MATMTPLAFGLLCFSSLFTVLDPIGVVPIFASMTSHVDDRARRRLAWRACLTALIALIAFAFAGTYLLRIFGVTLEAFRIGGGILFALLGLSMLGAVKQPEASHTDEAVESDPSIVPLGIPLIGGPGAMTTVMVLVGQAQGSSQLFMFAAALTGVIVLTCLMLVFAPALLKRLGPSGTALITKVMGLVVLVIGVQFVIDGAAAAFSTSSSLQLPAAQQKS